MRLSKWKFAPMRSTSGLRGVVLVFQGPSTDSVELGQKVDLSTVSNDGSAIGVAHERVFDERA